ncbi:MAG: alpha-mannosidase [bacterium]|nr:alpha-mannosidase [bacterium]
MQHIHVALRRIENWTRELQVNYYRSSVPLECSYTYDSDNPIPYQQLEKRTFERIGKGERWGELWSSAWFRFQGRVPQLHQGRKVVAVIDLGGEACVFKDGVPYQGLTYKNLVKGHETKRRVYLFDEAKGGEDVDLLVEAAATSVTEIPLPRDMAGGLYTVNEAKIAILDESVWQLALDVDFLLQLYRCLPPESARAKSILHELNKAANIWEAGQGKSIYNSLTEEFAIICYRESLNPETIAACRKITAELLSVPAAGSEPVAWAIGHAHMDLAWLWPIRETIRKGGRTFATVLRLLDEYPEFIFAASQPQLYIWIKQHYPVLYKRFKKAIQNGRIECQGAMWVEPDTNIPGGESLVRQMLYGKKFYREEFGQDIEDLWLPDVFGYSGALPQIMKRSGVHFFVTKKLMSNETNAFPHNTFIWEGIDGSRVIAHYVPAGNCNCNNFPRELFDAKNNFAQSGVHKGFLHAFGVGDGGGGPSRRQIEFGLRTRNCDSLPRFRFAKTEEFYSYLDAAGDENLPEWKGELYFEAHRGTYTSQAFMKKYNRQLELALRDVEFLGVVSGWYPFDEVEKLWKDTLLNQFHDILPGTSIDLVYEDAYEISRDCVRRLKIIERETLGRMFPHQDINTVTVVNTLPWERSEVIELPVDDRRCVLRDSQGILEWQSWKDGVLRARTKVPSMGYATFYLVEGHEPMQQESGIIIAESLLENNRIRVVLGDNGELVSLYDKSLQREMLAGNGANRLLLFDDKPYRYDAWDISAYYREVVPQQAALESREIIVDSGLTGEIRQVLNVGNSRIEQRIRLDIGSPLVNISCKVDWRERLKVLKVSANANIYTHYATFETQFGTLQRPTHENTTWDAAQFEVCGHRFADLSAANVGLALLNDCKYGHHVKGNTIELTLLKSPFYPDETCDQSTHAFSYAYFPHPGTVGDGQVLREAHNMNSPLILWKGAAEGENTARSFFSLKGGAVKIESVKRSERNEGFVVRLYETSGSHCRVELRTALSYEEVWETNLLEEREIHITKQHGPVQLDFSPFTIKTLLFAQSPQQGNN